MTLQGMADHRFTGLAAGCHSKKAYPKTSNELLGNTTPNTAQELKLQVRKLSSTTYLKCTQQFTECRKLESAQFNAPDKKSF